MDHRYARRCILNLLSATNMLQLTQPGHEPYNDGDYLFVLQVCGLLLTRPSYQGVMCSSFKLKQIIALCHSRGVPVIVDEAHGSHLRFLGRSDMSGVCTYDSYECTLKKSRDFLFSRSLPNHTTPLRPQVSCYHMPSTFHCSLSLFLCLFLPF